MRRISGVQMENATVPRRMERERGRKVCYFRSCIDFDQARLDSKPMQLRKGHQSQPWRTRLSVPDPQPRECRGDSAAVDRAHLTFAGTVALENRSIQLNRRSMGRLNQYCGSPVWPQRLRAVQLHS